MILRTILSTIGQGSSFVPPVTHLAVLWVHFLNWIITLLTSSLVFVWALFMVVQMCYGATLPG